MVVLQSVVAFVFMERHWNTVTRRLSAAVTQDIAALIDIYRNFPQDAEQTTLRRIAQERLGLVVDFLPGTDLPPIGPKPLIRTVGFYIHYYRHCESPCDVIILSKSVVGCQWSVAPVIRKKSFDAARRNI